MKGHRRKSSGGRRRRRRGGNTKKILGAFKSAKKVYDTIAKGVGFAGTSKKLSRSAQKTGMRLAKAKLASL
jgi:hypothetical protein